MIGKVLLKRVLCVTAAAILSGCMIQACVPAEGDNGDKINTITENGQGDDTNKESNEEVTTGSTNDDDMNGVNSADGGAEALNNGAKEGTLAAVAQIGDFVNYDANDNGSYSYLVDNELAGTDNYKTTYSSDDNTAFCSPAYTDVVDEQKAAAWGKQKWIVLDVDPETGVVELLAASPVWKDKEDSDAGYKELYLKGLPGYVNAIALLDEIGMVYGHGKGATGGRGLTVEDINKVTGFNPETDADSDQNYGKQYTYTEGTFYNPDGSSVIATAEQPVIMTNTGYDYMVTKSKLNENQKAYLDYESDVYQLFFNYAGVLLASQKILTFEPNPYGGLVYYSFYCQNFDGVGDMYNGIQEEELSISNYLEEGVNGSPIEFCVRPVVTLQADIMTDGKDENGAWILKLN